MKVTKRDGVVLLVGVVLGLAIAFVGGSVVANRYVIHQNRAWQTRLDKWTGRTWERTYHEPWELSEER